MRSARAPRLASLLQRLRRGRHPDAGSRLPRATAERGVPPPPPPSTSGVAGLSAAAPPIRPEVVTLLFDDGTVAELESDPVVKQRVAQLLRALPAPARALERRGR